MRLFRGNIIKGEPTIKLLICALLGYLLGSISPALIFSKLKGTDIRTIGTGNAGAANTLINLGPKFGVATALLDAAKAFASVLLAGAMAPGDRVAAAAAGVACIMGHIFPLYSGFRGGKGLACIQGVVLAFDIRVFLVMFAAQLLLVLAVDYIAAAPVAASVAFPPVYWLMTGCLEATVIYLLVAPVVVIKHVSNFRRIMAGREMPVSALWRGGSRG